MSAWENTVELDAAVSLRLLSDARMGRVGFWTSDGPTILPVNHRVLDGRIVFRTGLYTSVADGTRGGTVAFETDEVDDHMLSGWSVLVVGRAEHVEETVDMAETFHRLNEPWAPGSRPVVVRITPSQITGRQFTRP
jgi:nitroimidazol reductase NimA-like FMN-containing flavoprotein (pyridoxamine 5'-phosphate oxidase superfamily)